MTMKNTMIMIGYLTILMLSGCGRTHEQKVVAQYDKFLSENLSEVVKDSLPDMQEIMTSFTQLKRYAPGLDTGDINMLFRYQLEQVRLNLGPSLNSTGPAMFEDSVTQGRRVCASFDRAGPQVVKSYREERFPLAFIIPRRYVVGLTIHIIEDPNVGRVVSEGDLQRQLQVLNETFERINISFEVLAINRVNNAGWYRCSPVDEDLSTYLNMVNSLSDNHESRVNVYVNGMDAWGFGAFPWETSYRTSQDIVMVKDVTFPGKKIDAATMEGKTLIHEMGHFLGLYHTFHSDKKDENGKEIKCNSSRHNGCSPGDLVDDTPPQKICHSQGCGCSGNVGCDNCDGPCHSCNQVDDDPIRNFMGYNPDQCMNHFTTGQYNRMQTWFFDKRQYAVNSVIDLAL